MGYSAVVGGLLTMAIPLVASSVPLVVVARMIAGFTQGVMYPSAYALVGIWYPVAEKTTAYRIAKSM